MARGGVNSLFKTFYKDRLNKFINITNSDMRVLLSLRGVCKSPIQFTIQVYLHSTAQVKPRRKLQLQLASYTKELL
jgi:hypothetical protein